MIKSDGAYVALAAWAVLCYFYVPGVHGADLKIPPKPVIQAWICGYSAGFEDAIRQPTDSRTPESEQCAKFRAQAKGILK